MNEMRVSEQVFSEVEAAEGLWQDGQHSKAIERYDRALELARGSEDPDVDIGQLLLGKAVALLQQQDFDEAGRAVAAACLQECKSLAIAGGHTAQAQFVDMIIARDGRLELPSHTCAGHDGEVEKCSTDAAKHLASVDKYANYAAEKVRGASGGTDDGSEWTEALDVALVRLVSEAGAGDWQTKSESLQQHTGASQPPIPAAVEARWQQLKPGVKEALRLSEEEGKPLACGHQCRTCPTRKDCHLHDAVGDIEDLAMASG